METKQCSSCKEFFPRTKDYFYAAARNKDGLTGQCKGCRDKKIKEWATNNPERVLATSAKWRSKHPDKTREFSKKRTESGKSAAYQRQWRAEHREHVLEKEKQWRAENPDKVKEYNKKHRQNNPESRARADRHQKLKNKYGLTLETYKTGCRLQDNKCSICNKKVETLCVDHDHITEEVRGLLCTNCNHLLSNALDNPEILSKAIGYLQNPPGIPKDSELGERDCGIINPSTTEPK